MVVGVFQEMRTPIFARKEQTNAVVDSALLPQAWHGMIAVMELGLVTLAEHQDVAITDFLLNQTGHPATVEYRNCKTSTHLFSFVHL
jgi:hypothetical protein